MVGGQRRYDEVLASSEARGFCKSEAVRRLLQFDISKRCRTVIRLYVNLGIFSSYTFGKLNSEVPQITERQAQVLRSDLLQSRSSQMVHTPSAHTINGTLSVVHRRRRGFQKPSRELHTY